MEKQLANELIEFIFKSPTSYHVVSNAEKELVSHGYKKLFPGDAWKIDRGGKYFVTPNNSSLFAFEIGSEDISQGIKLICAHSDSPFFRIKPEPEMTVGGKYLKLNTEVYGSPILNTWFDRPLSIAGRVMIKGSNPFQPETRLLNFDRPLAVIPNLAIHLSGQSPVSSNQKEMLPIIGMVNETFERENYLLNLIAKEIKVTPEEILDFDLALYQYEKGCIFGTNNELISSGRLDDLAMVYTGLRGLLDSVPCKQTKVLAIFDNEEVGSGSKQGAASPVLRTIIERIVFGLGNTCEDLYRCINNSFMISADMAHALHPNYAEKHDPTNHPVMNAGPVIKYNANQKYITDAVSAAVFMTICEMANVPFQKFVNHSDIKGGSTLGCIFSTQMEIRGVDIGNAMWGMHSIRETAGVMDIYYVFKAFRCFYNL